MSDRKFFFLFFVTLFPLIIMGYRTIDIGYYELPPYIYKSKNGSLQGIFPEIFQDLSRKCYTRYKYDLRFNYSLDMMSANNFSTYMNQEDKMGRMAANRLWLPLTQRVSEETMSKLNLKAYRILPSGIDIIVHRDKIGVFAKIKVGIFECRHLFLIGLMLSIIFGVLIWFVERWRNVDFPKNSHGVFTGLWLGLVTMTTVGYGDIAPKSTVGKLLTMSWMLTGISLIAILKRTMANIFRELHYMNIHGKKVASLYGPK